MTHDLWYDTSIVKVRPFYCKKPQKWGVFLSPVQVNLYQKLLFLHQLTHNMTTDCSLNYKFNTWKFQAQTWGEHVVYRNCFWHSEQFLYTTCSPHVLQKEELLTKIYLYSGTWLHKQVRVKIKVPEYGSRFPSTDFGKKRENHQHFWNFK